MPLNPSRESAVRIRGKHHERSRQNGFADRRGDNRLNGNLDLFLALPDMHSCDDGNVSKLEQERARAQLRHCRALKFKQRHYPARDHVHFQRADGK
jgi:hypothetical protein